MPPARSSTGLRICQLDLLVFVGEICNVCANLTTCTIHTVFVLGRDKGYTVKYNPSPEGSPKSEGLALANIVHILPPIRGLGQSATSHPQPVTNPSLTRKTLSAHHQKNVTLPATIRCKKKNLYLINPKLYFLSLLTPLAGSQENPRELGEVVALLVRGGRGGVEVDLGTGGRQAREYRDN